MPVPKSTLALHLADAGYSITEPRRLVFEALETKGPMTMAELATHLSGRPDRSSIYRTAALFEKLGIIQRVSQGWKYKLELTDTFLPHHHHLTCLRCRRIVSFDEPAGFDGLLQEVSKAHGFITSSHSLEIEGLCPDCQASAG